MQGDVSSSVLPAPPLPPLRLIPPPPEVAITPTRVERKARIALGPVTHKGGQLELVEIAVTARGVVVVLATVSVTTVSGVGLVP